MNAELDQNLKKRGRVFRFHFKLVRARELVNECSGDHLGGSTLELVAHLAIADARLQSVLILTVVVAHDEGRQQVVSDEHARARVSDGLSILAGDGVAHEGGLRHVDETTDCASDTAEAQRLADVIAAGL